MNVLVTGAAGKLGSRVVQHLVDEGFTVRATDRRFDSSLPVKVEPANLLDSNACYQLLEGCEGLVHLANYPSAIPGLPRQTIYGENVAMTGNVLLAAADLGVKRIAYASTIQVIAGRRRANQVDEPSGLAYLPLDGDLPQRPGNVYALSKVAGEDLLEHLCELDPTLSATAVRFPALWRPEWAGHRRPRPRNISSMERTPADEGFTFLLLDDAARLVAAILRRQRPGYHRMLPAAAESALGWPVEEVADTFYPGVPRKHADRPLESLVDTSGITEAVGWEPSPTPAPPAEAEAAHAS